MLTAASRELIDFRYFFLVYAVLSLNVRRKKTLYIYYIIFALDCEMERAYNAAN